MSIVFSGMVVPVIFFILIFSFFLYFIVHAAMAGFNRKKKCPQKYIMTASVSLSAILLVSSDIVCYKCVTEFLVYEIAVAVCPMVAGLKSETDFKHIMPYILVVLGFSCLVLLCRIVFVRCRYIEVLLRLTPSVLSVSLIVMQLVAIIRMISDRNCLLKAVSVKNRVESEMGMLYILGLLSVLFIHNFTSGCDGWYRVTGFILCLSAVILLFYCCHVRITTGRMFVFDKRRDETLKSVISLNACEIKENAKIDQNYRSIYERLIVYFEKEKPYLDPDISVDEVARKLFCNRLYLSRAISLFSGRNFCQYVNYYRIKYAVSVFEENVDLKMQQWAEKAGFKNTTSFTMAFRLFMNESPGDWARRLKGAIPRPKCKKMLIDG